MNLRRQLEQLDDQALSIALRATVERGPQSALPAVLGAPRDVVARSSLPPLETAPSAVRTENGGGESCGLGRQPFVPWEALARRYVKTRLTPSRRRSYQGVTCFTGMPGSGKTYSLSEVGVSYRARGWPVWSNYGFDFGMSTGDDGCHVYRSFEELASIPGPACILIDEAQLYFNARKWQEFPDGFLYRLSQVRKDGIHLYYTSLFWDMIDKNLRNLTFWVWECEAAAFRGRFIRRRFPPEHARKRDERAFDKHRVKVAPAIAELYDTTSKVAVAAPSKVSARETAQWALPAARVPEADSGGRRHGAAPASGSVDGSHLTGIDHPPASGRAR